MNTTPSRTLDFIYPDESLIATVIIKDYADKPELTETEVTNSVAEAIVKSLNNRNEVSNAHGRLKRELVRIAVADDGDLFTSSVYSKAAVPSVEFSSDVGVDGPEQGDFGVLVSQKMKAKINWRHCDDCVKDVVCSACPRTIDIELGKEIVRNTISVLDLVLNAKIVASKAAGR